MMKTIKQQQLTLRWTVRLSIGFFLIYAVAVAIKAPGVYGEIKDVFPAEMQEKFILMVIVAPFLFTLLFFCVCFVVLRLAFFVYGTWRKLISFCGLWFMATISMLSLLAGCDPRGKSGYPTSLLDARLMAVQKRWKLESAEWKEAELRAILKEAPGWPTANASLASHLMEQRRPDLEERQRLLSKALSPSAPMNIKFFAALMSSDLAAEKGGPAAAASTLKKFLADKERYGWDEASMASLQERLQAVEALAKEAPKP